MSKRMFAFIAGFVLAAFLFRSPVVDAAVSVLMAGTYNGAARTVAVSSTGRVLVQVN